MADQNEIITSQPDNRDVMDVAIEAGHILLENGAEIFRVEDTMRRIAKHYGVETEEFFVLSNGIFSTDSGKAFTKGHARYARIQHIPVKGARLDRVVAVNQLSREIEEGKYTLEEVAAKLQEIKVSKGKTIPIQILASGVGAACFCCLFGGNFLDAAAAFTAGLILYTFVIFVSGRYMSKITGNICGGMLVTLICLFCHKIGFGTDLSHMIIGSIIPLVPGVPFTNGIRDIADGDYISGAVRLLDALLVFLCIAIGVGVVFLVYQRAFGGSIL